MRCAHSPTIASRKREKASQQLGCRSSRGLLEAGFRVPNAHRVPPRQKPRRAARLLLSGLHLPG
ncbi:hypothetical protein BDY21DRAFT_334450 [Lineolata rhizophorae]|uniref:Uncharacterized protein n=1 Tax=Lineolata rhizophorae TaxID=578093 RepID=A0A6A6PAY7_9PEZI|nr:hypothetical protein BDY21DRAFT_334450 [Lineolata rhizophorae]